MTGVGIALALFGKKKGNFSATNTPGILPSGEAAPPIKSGKITDSRVLESQANRAGFYTLSGEAINTMVNSWVYKYCFVSLWNAAYNTGITVNTTPDSIKTSIRSMAAQMGYNPAGSGVPFGPPKIEITSALVRRLMELIGGTVVWNTARASVDVTPIIAALKALQTDKPFFYAASEFEIKEALLLVLFDMGIISPAESQVTKDLKGGGVGSVGIGVWETVVNLGVKVISGIVGIFKRKKTAPAYNVEGVKALLQSYGLTEEQQTIIVSYVHVAHTYLGAIELTGYIISGQARGMDFAPVYHPSGSTAGIIGPGGIVSPTGRAYPDQNESGKGVGNFFDVTGNILGGVSGVVDIYNTITGDSSENQEE